MDFGINQNNTFLWAMIFSFSAHLILIFRAPFLSESAYMKMKETIEITYESITKSSSIQDLQIQDTANRAAVYTHKIIKDLPSLKNYTTGIKKAAKIEKIPVSLELSDKKINIVGIKSDIPKSKAYDEYSVKVRDAIREKVYANFDGYNEGSVYVSFVVFKDGALKDVLVHDDKSISNDYLKSIVKKSVSEAAPFEPFPMQLNYPKITYSVEVSFELK